MELMCGQRKRSDIQLAKIDGHFSNCLHAIDVQRYAVRFTPEGQRRNVLHHAGFVMGEDDRGEFDLIPRETVETVQEDPSFRIDLDKTGPPALALQLAARF